MNINSVAKAAMFAAGDLILGTFVRAKYTIAFEPWADINNGMPLLKICLGRSDFWGVYKELLVKEGFSQNEVDEAECDYIDDEELVYIDVNVGSIFSNVIGGIEEDLFFSDTSSSSKSDAEAQKTAEAYYYDECLAVVNAIRKKRGDKVFKGVL